MNDKPSESKTHPIALGVAIAAGIFAVILRIVPHPTNFSSVGACSLFGGARVRAWHAYLLPLVVMIISDLCLWMLWNFDYNYSLAHPSRIFVYASFMIYVWIGRWLRERDSVGSVALAATVGGLQFFVLTNFCEWLFQPMYYTTISEQYRYARDLSGLATCFVAALPFYRSEAYVGEHPFVILTDPRLNIVWTVLGDILFTSAYILIHAKLSQRDETAPQAAMMQEAHS